MSETFTGYWCLVTRNVMTFSLRFLYLKHPYLNIYWKNLKATSKKIFNKKVLGFLHLLIGTGSLLTSFYLFSCRSIEARRTHTGCMPIYLLSSSVVSAACTQTFDAFWRLPWPRPLTEVQPVAFARAHWASLRGQPEPTPPSWWYPSSCLK